MVQLTDIRLFVRTTPNAARLLSGAAYLASEAYTSGIGKIETKGARLLNVTVYQVGELAEPETYPTEPDGRDGLIADEIRIEADLNRIALAEPEEQVAELLNLIHEGTIRLSRARSWHVDAELEAARRRWGAHGFTSFAVPLLEKSSRDGRLVAKLVATISLTGMRLTVVAETRTGGRIAASNAMDLGRMTLATRNSFPGQLKWLSSQEVVLQPKPRRKFDEPLHEVSLRVPDSRGCR
ncbi:hypothetical protein OO014_09350 [Intrasporangium calvum]|uniref:Uncharacterized protein n=1 Tax=Intrasporangium calvum TaxID=53358 RepID=A0ABT5GGW0_9MICO|nr:hypothetical protein [Intrasporangium calvum]MDC5697462.1 hypothetical protein [Intrasporangium calvum]